MSPTNRYIVTDKAGPKVAGRRVQSGETIELTENAARGELLAGAIVPEPPASTDTPAAADAPAEAETRKKR